MSQNEPDSKVLTQKLAHLSDNEMVGVLHQNGPP